MVQEFTVEKSEVEKFMVEKSEVERSGIRGPRQIFFCPYQRNIYLGAKLEGNPQAKVSSNDSQMALYDFNILQMMPT